MKVSRDACKSEWVSFPALQRIQTKDGAPYENIKLHPQSMTIGTDQQIGMINRAGID